MTIKRKCINRVIIIAIMIMALVGPLTNVTLANGQLVIERPPMPRHQFHPLILERQDVKTSIDGQIATTHIKQVWRNNNNMMLEGTFIFPLPMERATMSDFVLWMDGKKLTFETMEAGKARQIYEDIVRSMMDPGLLEYAGDGILKCRIFPIPPNGTKEIELEYREVLIKEGTLTRYEFPLKIQNLPEPLKNLLVDVSIKSKSPMGRVYSPTHDVQVEQKDSYNARVTLEKSNYTPSSEFVLFVTQPQNEFGFDLISYKPSDEDGFFLGMISPRFDLDTSKQKAIPKDFIFILDTSGSMEGEKIIQAKDALKYILKNLNPDDRFGIITFSSDVQKFKDKLVSKSELQNALVFVDKLSAKGGTFIDGALKEGLSFTGGSQDRPFYIIFLTDGLPTVGEQNVDIILKNVEKANERKARVFSFGVGDDVNIAFIDRLAREQGGVAVNVAPNENLEMPVSELYEKIKSPVLTNLSFSISGINAYDIYPEKLPDLFKGGQIVITGRFTGSGKVNATLKGKIGGSQQKSFSYQSEIKLTDDNPYIAPLWANRKVGYLLNEIRLYGEKQEMVDQVVKLAKKYGIITPYTSNLVLEDQPMQPLGPWVGARGGGGGSGREPITQMVAPTRIADDVRSISNESKAKESAESLEEARDKDASGEQVKHVDDKTFVLKNNFWTDSAYDEESKLNEVKIKFMSDEYFKLLDKYPDIGKYLAIGENLKLVWNDTLYIISEK